MLLDTRSISASSSPSPLRQARQRSGRRAALVLAALALSTGVLAGCSIIPEPTVDPTRYYLLSGEAGAGPDISQEGNRSLHLALRVVELPGYLRNNRTMVVRHGVNEVRYEDYARWAEPLDVAVQRIVRDKLLSSGAVATAEVPPFSPQIQRDFEISVRVLRCEGATNESGDKAAQFVAVYEIADTKNDSKIAVRKQFSAPLKEWNGSDYAALARLLTESVEALGDAILADLPK